MLKAQSFLFALTLLVLTGVLVALAVFRLYRQFSSFAVLVMLELLGEVGYVFSLAHPEILPPGLDARLLFVLDAVRLLALIGCPYQLARVWLGR